jgi:hypothetical protein
LKISVITILECGSLLALSPEGPPLFLLLLVPGPGNLCPRGILFAAAPARQPVNHSEKKYHRHNQPRISRRNPHVSQHHDVPRGHEQRWNHDDEKRSIYRLTRFPNS